MARPQTYLRGLHRAGGYMVGGTGIFHRAYSTTTPLLTADSTGIIVAGGVRVSNKANGVMTANSTGLQLVGALYINGTAVPITKNSTGLKIGARYISTNTTGNLVT